jgi:hypothetical protein
MKFLVFTFLLILSINFHAFADSTYKTSKGATFRQVTGPGTFGLSWEDQYGRIWSHNIGNYSNHRFAPDHNGLVVSSPAVNACKEIGGRVPTWKEYRLLQALFEHAQIGPYLSAKGKNDWHYLFDDLEGISYWTRTAASTTQVTHFEPYYNVFGVGPWISEDTLAVRCVSGPVALP